MLDAVIVGGGPGGLAAALALGRARRRVLLCDAGERRNAAAEEIHNFVTRDGTPPEAFRRMGREDLARYPSVEVRDARVEAITGARGAFRVRLGGGAGGEAGGELEARRILLATGMIDEMLPIPGFAERWGHAIFQCPYCHGWEVQDQRWGYLGSARDAGHLLPFAMMAKGWTRDLVVFTGGEIEVPDEARARFDAVGIKLETAPVARLLGEGKRLEAVELAGGREVPLDVLFTHPPQRHVDIVRSLGVALDDHGYVEVDPMMRETSVPGVYAAGDLTTRMQGAVFAAAAGTQAAAAINGVLAMEG